MKSPLIMTLITLTSLLLLLSCNDYIAYDGEGYMRFYYVRSYLEDTPLIIEGESLGVKIDADTLLFEESLHLYSGRESLGGAPQSFTSSPHFKYMNCDRVIYRSPDSTIFHVSYPQEFFDTTHWARFRYEYSETPELYYFWDIYQ